MSESDDLANEYRQTAVEELQNVSSKLGDVDAGLDRMYSTLEGIDSTLNTIDSTLDQANFGIEKVSSKIEEVDSTLGDINAKLLDANNRLEAIGSTLSDIKTTQRQRGSYDWLVIFAIIFLIGSWPSSKPDRFTDRLWYSVYYDASWKNVDIQRRPTDCDFLQAPIGSKRCSYSKDKLVFGEAERQQLKAQAETQQEKDAISLKPNNVTVYWQRREEP